MLASYIFYAAWNPPFILLLWLSTVIDYFVGRELYTQQNKHKRNLLLVLSLAGNLGMLCFFKYGTFFLENFTHLVNLLGWHFHPAKPNIILPAGISFYTFTTLCYTVDMYQRKSKPIESILDFSLFVTFFPHLVAGPIVRPPQLVPQFETERKASLHQLMQGLLLLTLGLFMKVVMADAMLAPAANKVFDSTDVLGTLDAWMGVLAFSGQIFFDFAGYSTCAIGVALCLGFVLPQNFLYPYAAVGFSDFWRRWHITLSAWLRDYLYIPIGGNRKGKFRAQINIMITMLLGGLWHGANWTFVAWGALHGLYLWAEKLIENLASKAVTTEGVQMEETTARAKNKTALNLLLALFTFLLVNVTWVFFRAADFTSAWRLLSSMFTVGHAAKPLLESMAILKVSVIVTILFICHWLMRNTRVLVVAEKLAWWQLGLLWSAMLILLILSQESGGAFIYFQF